MTKLLTLLLFYTTSIFADIRTIEELHTIALNVAKTIYPNKHFTIDTNQSTCDTDNEDNTTYKVILLKPTGWVIVSKEDRLTPIIGYNLDTKYAVYTIAMPSAFTAWMHDIHKNSMMTKEKISENHSLLSAWKDWTSSPKAFPQSSQYMHTAIGATQKGPLIGKTIEWGQTAPYWNLTPMIEGRHTYVGCVATAMSQIMAYHKWPDRGEGSYAYTHWKYGTLSANFDTRYHWTNMTAADKAKISYHLGVASQMDYGEDVSVGWPQTKRWKQFFKYDMSRWIQKNDVSDTTWEQRIKDNIDRGLPIYYMGRSAEGTHAFILEGYQTLGNTTLYYFNWGWGGEKNGWFSLGGNFTKYQSAIFDIQPHKETPTAPSTLLANADIHSATLTWKDLSSNAEGFKVYAGDSLINILGANVTHYSITGLTSDTSYTYSISSYNEAGESTRVPLTFKTLSQTVYLHPIEAYHQVAGAWKVQRASVHREGAYAGYYTFTLQKKTSVEIQLNSEDDSYMFLLEGKGTKGHVIAYNDDYKSINARIFKVLDAGTYTIEATTFDIETIGNFTLEWKPLF